MSLRASATSAVWTPPRPAEIPPLRAHMVEHLRTPTAQNYTTLVLTNLVRGEAGGAIIPSAGSLARSAAILHHEESTRLAAARLYHVTPEMTRSAVRAGHTMPDWDPRPEDLPAKQGFMLFSDPIAHRVNDNGLRTQTVGCSWGRSSFLEKNHTAGVWLTFWSATDFRWLIDDLRNSGHSVAEARRLAFATHGDLSWETEVMLTWNPDELTIKSPIPSPLMRPQRTVDGRPGVVDVNGYLAERRNKKVFAPSEHAGEWTRTVWATWLLIQQSGFTEVTEQHQSRKAQRQAEREGYNPDAVRVVDLHPRRKRRTAAAGDGTPLEYHQDVDGHWKQQAWGPAWSLHRRCYVDDYERGPKDGLTRPKQPVVYRVDTPPDGAVTP